jgi:hypothetical protein
MTEWEVLKQIDATQWSSLDTFVGSDAPKPALNQWLSDNQDYWGDGDTLRIIRVNEIHQAEVSVFTPEPEAEIRLTFHTE